MTDRHTITWGALALVLLTACGGKPAADAAEEEHHDEAPATQVTLTPEAAQAAGITSASVGELLRPGASTAIEAPGQVEGDPSRMAYVSSRAAGRLERLSAAIGDRVAAGQVVALVQSAAFLTAQHDLQHAFRREAAVAQTIDSTGARALRRAAEDRLRLFGVGDTAVASLREGRPPMALLPVTAPFAGSLVEALALAGSAVEPGTPIFRLIDLSELDIAADVPERDLPLLRIGQSAQVLIPAYPDLRLTGRVERIKDELDPTTRTIEALIHVHNPDRVLRPGMFARVLMQAPKERAAASVNAFTIPASAVISDGEQRYVFVEHGTNSWERRDVRLGSNDARFGGVGANAVIVEDGLTKEDRVVVQGAFMLKSELAKAGLGDHH